MRIWAFPSFYPYDFPGMKWNGIFAHRQYKGLQASGADIRVVRPVLWSPVAPFHHADKEWKKSAEYKYPAEEVYDGITVYYPRIANMKPNRVFGGSYGEKCVDAIVGFFRKNKIKIDPTEDIFFAQWLPDAAWVVQAAKILGLKSAVVAIGDDVLIWPYSNQAQYDIIRNTLVNADVRFAVAKRLANEAEKIAGGMPCNTIRRGVNYDFFTPYTADQKAQIRREYNIPADKTIILNIGVANIRKGWLDLFDALKEVKKKNSDFLLVGIQGNASVLNLDEEAAKRGLQQEFMNLVEVAPELINRVHNIADIFCLPSHSEGIANSVVEAMATGVAVITTDVGSHDQLIQNGVNGILLPPQDPALLTEALLTLLNDKGKRAQMGKQAREFIVHEWGSFDDNAARLYKMLAAALKQ